MWIRVASLGGLWCAGELSYAFVRGFWNSSNSFASAFDGPGDTDGL